MSCTDDLDGKQGDKICYNVNLDLVSKIIKYTTVISIVVFLVYISLMYLKCKKFYWGGFSFILVAFSAILSIYLSVLLFAKVTDKSTDKSKVGQHMIEKGKSRNNLYIILVGQIITILLFIVYLFTHITKYFDCDIKFNWGILAPSIVSLVVSLLYLIVG
tara:strand:+ start:128 stop:607 length:480 start_codon:yes stop_codon:yes gene_type:complete